MATGPQMARNSAKISTIGEKWENEKSSTPSQELLYRNHQCMFYSHDGLSHQGKSIASLTLDS